MKLKRKTIAELIVILAIIAVAMFAGCIEEEALTPTSTKVWTYKIFSEEDVSFGNTIRVVERVLVPRTITEEGVKAIAKDIVQKGIASRDVNAIGIFFYYKPEASPEYCIGSVDWAPYGVWSKAMEVPTGDYSKHEYYYDFFTKLPLPPSTSMPAPTPTPTPVTEQAKKFSALEITDVTYESGQVKVFGTTDLPDGAVLMMQLDAPTGLCAQGKSKVENGEFTMTFGPFKEPYDFDTKPYEVSALLTPVNQPDSVSRLVGEKGEHLTGALVTYASFAGNILETMREFNTQRTFPTEYPMIDPNSYATGTPERLMADWLSCWKQEEWDKMFTLTSKTWRGDEELPELFEVDYYCRKLLGAEVIEIDTEFENEVSFKIRAYYLYEGTTIHKEWVFYLDVVRESAPYTLSSTGDWGVDPVLV